MPRTIFACDEHGIVQELHLGVDGVVVCDRCPRCGSPTRPVSVFAEDQVARMRDAGDRMAGAIEDLLEEGTAALASWRGARL